MIKQFLLTKAILSLSQGKQYYVSGSNVSFGTILILSLDHFIGGVSETFGSILSQSLDHLLIGEILSTGSVEYSFEALDLTALLYLKGDGTNESTNIIDSSSYNKTITRTGDPRISTTQSKYGGSSILFDLNDYLTITPNIDLGTGNYTIEFWIYPLTINSNNGVLAFGNRMLEIAINANQIIIKRNNNSQNIIQTAITANTWSHFALVRNGTSLKLYKNGVQSGATPTNSDNITGSSIIGYYVNTSFTLNAYLDSFRVKNTAFYTTNFDPELDTGLAY
jgi:hypothetical protein